VNPTFQKAALKTPRSLKASRILLVLIFFWCKTTFTYPTANPVPVMLNLSNISTLCISADKLAKLTIRHSKYYITCLQLLVLRSECCILLISWPLITD